YQRRQYVLAHWKKQPGTNSDMKVPTICIPTSPPITVPVPVEQLQISDSGSSDSTHPGESDVANSTPVIVTVNHSPGPSVTVEASTDVTPSTTSGVMGVNPQLATDQDVDMDKGQSTDAANKDQGVPMDQDQTRG
ncbi:hypothetical protein V5O48_016267, partial [Marasmius crinis-equi]